MNRKKVGVRLLTVVGAVSATVAVAAAHQSARWLYNGSPVSSDIKIIGGKAYVPLADVARATGMQVSRKGSDYVLAPAGGANQVKGYEGKLGAEVFTGQFKFQVKAIREASSYTTRNIRYKAELNDIDKTQKLVILDCRVKNGTTAMQELIFDTGSYGIQKISLTDAEEHSYQPINWHGSAFKGFDVHEDEGAPVGAKILPGAALDFVLVFSVPQDTKPRDLVYGLLKYADRGPQTDKATYVRIHLAP